MLGSPIRRSGACPCQLSAGRPPYGRPNRAAAT